MTLGEKLQELRKGAGLSQEEVAGRLFVSRQSVSKWENDQAEPGVENLKALAALYGVSMDELTGMPAPPGRSFSWTKVGDDVWTALTDLRADMRTAFSSLRADMEAATGMRAVVKDLFTSEKAVSLEPEAGDGREERAVSFYHVVFWTRTAVTILECLLLSPMIPLDWLAMLLGLLLRKTYVWAGIQVILWISAGLNLLNLFIAPGIGIIGLFLAYLFLCAVHRQEVKDYFHIGGEGGVE